MDASQLQHVVVSAVNQAVSSGGTSPGQAITILECVKLDVFLQVKELEKQQKTGILPVRGSLPRNGAQG